VEDLALVLEHSVGILPATQAWDPKVMILPEHGGGLVVLDGGAEGSNQQRDGSTSDHK
jgi:hypothetical protein